MSRFAGLPEALRERNARAQVEDEMPDDDEDEGCSGTPARKKKDDPDMTDTPNTEALAAARSEGFKAATERFNAVLASEHYAGREELAKSMLSSDKLDAGEIIAFLAASPKAAAVETTVDSEEIAREEMRAALAETANSDISQADAPAPNAAARAASVWATAMANEFRGARV